MVGRDWDVFLRGLSLVEEVGILYMLGDVLVREG